MSSSSDRRPRSLRKAARERYREIAAEAEGLTPVPQGERWVAALPPAPSKLQQIEAAGGAGEIVERLERAKESAPHPDPLPALAFAKPKRLRFGGARSGERGIEVRGREEIGAGGERGKEVSLTERVRALYETTVVPVREIARLLGVSERTLYKYVELGRWRRRYPARGDAVRRANTDTRRQPSPGFVAERGAGGRFVKRGERSDAHGLKALDPRGADVSAELCLRARFLADASAQAARGKAAERKERSAQLREVESHARTLALTVRALVELDAAARLRRVRAADAPARRGDESGDDDMPLDEFRRELALRLEAMVAQAQRENS